MTNINDLRKQGQSVWLDYLDRPLIKSGKLIALIGRGVWGVTSNPTIFHEALRDKSAYARQLSTLLETGNYATEDLYEALIIKDIQEAADLLARVYKQTDGQDGFVSLEVSPELAYDTDGTIDAVHRLYKQVNRPNVMFKVPATKEGIPAIESLIGDGININITLMFSMAHYEAVVDAYIAGLNCYARKHDDVGNVASVASFFISRVDAKLDDWLAKTDATHLQGRIGIANAKRVYQRFQETFNSVHWQSLKEQGAQPQRLLWASTSVKDPSYPDTLYIDNLIGSHTVNTMPLSTLEAFTAQGTVMGQTVVQGVEQAEQDLEALRDANINLYDVCEQLQREGVDKFLESYRSIIGSLEKQRQDLARTH